MYKFKGTVSGAFMVPVGRLLLLKVFGKEELIKVFILIAIPSILGPLIAPIIGGLIVAHLHWGFIFLVNVPVGLIGLIITYWFVDNYTEVVDKFNWSAFIWLGVFLAVIAFIFDTMFYPISIELQSKNRLINYDLFNIRTFRECFISNVIMRVGFGGRVFVLAIYLEYGLKLSAMHVALLMSSAAVGFLFGRILVKKILPHLGFRRALLITNGASIITSLMYIMITKGNVLAYTIVISNSFFTTILFLLLNTLYFADVTEKDYAVATSISNTVQQLSNSMGITIIAMILFLSNLFLPHFSHTVFIVAFGFIALMGFILQFFILRLKPNDGRNLYGK